MSGQISIEPNLRYVCQPTCLPCNCSLRDAALDVSVANALVNFPSAANPRFNPTGSRSEDCDEEIGTVRIFVFQRNNAQGEGRLRKQNYAVLTIRGHEGVFTTCPRPQYFSERIFNRAY